MKTRTLTATIFTIILIALVSPVIAGSLYGYLRDENWYARRSTSDPYGVGVYEFGMNANGRDITSVGGADFTHIFGDFSMTNIPGGTYTVGSWSIWWRPAHAFNVVVPASGTVSNVDLRLKGTMWGYAAMWDPASYYEHGQTFRATGPISMIYLRCPSSGSFTLTVHEGGPSGPQIGVTRTIGGGDSRVAYSYGDMPTVAGQMYYLRIRTSSTSIKGIINEFDPRPDYSDPMPDGCLYQGNGGTPVAHPNRDLGVCIMSDDDGLITNLYNLSSGGNLNNVTSVGQTFVARGVGLIRASIHSPTSGFVGVFRIREGGPGGAQVGTIKRASVGQWATPEIIALWAPGECPLTPGNTYYLEVTRDGGGSFIAYASSWNPYPFGHAFSNGTAMTNYDLTGNIMEEASAGSATQQAVRFINYPTVLEANRGNNSLTVQWTTNVASDALIEWAEWNPPYTQSNYHSAQVSSHSYTITGLKPNTMYHYRVTSARSGYRSAVSRDLVICTKPDPGTNLLVNPDFEEGSGASPRWPIPGWSAYGLDTKASSGNWFHEVKPYSGTWFVQAAVCGSDANGALYQRVAATPGTKYNFTAFILTLPLEKINNQTLVKYDVWNTLGGNRLEWVQVGIDPTGGTNADSGSIVWTPRMYSHQKYTNLGINAVAQSNYVTVFVKMQSKILEWSIFGIDACALTVDAPPCTPPAITTQPSSQTKCPGQSATFSVAASGTTPLSYQWRKNNSNISGATSSSYTISSVSASHAGSYDCVVTNACGSATSNAAVLTVAATGTIPELKMLADASPVCISGKAVTAVLGNAFYIQESNRSAGIRVERTSHGMSPGMKASVSGIIRTNGNGERFIDAASVSQDGTGTARALALINREVGGNNWEYNPATGAGQKGVKDASGLNNIGMLVWTIGRVGYVGSDFFYIDDGSALNDGSGHTGLKVMASGLSLPSQGSMVRIYGISSCFTTGGNTYRVVYATEITPQP